MAAKKKTRLKKRIRGPQTKRPIANGSLDGSKSNKDELGKFLPGHNLGGNPLAGVQASFRAALIRAARLVDPASKTARFDRICNTLLRKAEKGDNWALGEVFNRLCGKHGAIADDDATPTPPASCSGSAPAGDVTINSQINNYNLPPETQDRIAALTEIAIKALDRDKIIEQP